MASNKYTPETLQKALSEINNGTMTVYKASKIYKVPRQTLYDKVNDKYKKQNRTGAPTVLSQKEEALIVDWVIMMAQIGFPVTKDILVQSVRKLVAELGRANKFKEGYPGRHWFEGFLKRNPEISKRVCQPLTTARVSATEEKIKAWFRRVQQYFENNDLSEVLKDPSRIFNCDESAFFFCPKGQAVLTRKGSKSVYCRSGNDDKECLTLLLGASADGKLMPTLALFPYKRLPGNILAKYPKNWSIGRSDNGWMTSENFFEYIANVFNPFLEKEKIQKPVVLFLDGHVSHLSFHLCKFCKDNGIILIALLPSSTHVLQPMDVAIFHSLKNAWSKNVYSWRMENNARRLKREDFGPVIEKSIEETLKKETLKNGFRKCGLYPFNENAVDYSRLITTSATSSNPDSRASSVSSLPRISATAQKSSEFLTHFEELLETEKLDAFQQCSGEWIGDIRDENLYYFWKKVRDLYPNRNPSFVATPDSMHLGDSTIDANDCTLTGITLDWLNDDVSVLDMVVDKDDTLIPCASFHATNEIIKTDQSTVLKNDSNTEKNLLDSGPGTQNMRKSEIYTDRQYTEPDTLRFSPTVKKGKNKENTPIDINDNNETIKHAQTINEDTSDNKSNRIDKDSSTEKVASINALRAIENFNNSLSDMDRTTEKDIDQHSVKSVVIEPKTPPTQTVSTEVQNRPQSEIVDMQSLHTSQQSRFPTPFKNSLLWPETPSSSKNKKMVKKKLIPTVASSEEYIEHQRRLMQEKKDKIEKAEQRKIDRINKKTGQQQKEKTKGKKSAMSLNNLQEESTNKELNEERKENTKNREKICKGPVTGDFVVVNYEGEKFPGQILRICNDKPGHPKYVVKTMTMSGFVNGRVNWRWPDKDDVLDYDAKDIMKKINSPTPVNKRGVFSVPDLN